jgi:outer membrane lipoprotein LolB
MRALLIFLMAAFLAACAQYKPQTPIQEDVSAIQSKSAQHLRDLDNIKHWELNGRIGFRSARNAHSASIVWQQKNEHFNILLSGPLGQGSMRLAGDTQHMTLQRGLELLRSNAPQQLLNQELGVFLPLTQSRHWVVGHPGKMSSAASISRLDNRLDNNGNLLYFESEGWGISYQDYHPINKIPMPHKIILQNKHDKITLIIKSWRIY